MSKSIKRITLSLFGLAAVAAVVLYMVRSRSFASSQAPSYQTTRVSKDNFSWSITATGVVEPKAVTEIRSLASGEIRNIYVEVGQKVKKGQLLMTLDTRLELRRVNQARADLSVAYANYSKANSSYKHAQATNKRLQMLLKRGLISREEGDNAANQVTLSKADRSLRYAQIRKAKETLKEAQERLRDTKLYAPSAGVILQRYVQPGQIISSGVNSASGGTLLLRMADLDDLYVRGSVDEADVSKVKEGMAVTITADALLGKAYKGTIHRVDPEGKNQNNVTVFEIVVKLGQKATKAMKINMSTNLKFIVAQHKDVLTVPSMAIKRIGKDATVLVLKGKRAKRARVEVGMSNGMKTIIKKGLQEGDQVVLSVRSSGKKRKGRRGGKKSSMSMRNMRRMMKR